MYSASSVIKRLILIHVFAIQLLPTNSDLSLNTTNEYLNHKCLVNQGKYKPGSEYEDRLKRTIKMIYSGSNKGYDGIGDPTFSAILQCRGDSYGRKCRDCYATAVAAVMSHIYYRISFFLVCINLCTVFDTFLHQTKKLFFSFQKTTLLYVN